ncbi:MAG: cyclophilin-like family protein, partial [Pseudomonadota bacterium]
LFSIVETWGESIHFEIPVRAPRDRTARLNGRPEEAYYWADDERVVLCYGPTPISAPNEIRLMRPCNVWAAIEGDPAVLKGTVPGTKVSLTRADVAG